MNLKPKQVGIVIGSVIVLGLSLTLLSTRSETPLPVCLELMKEQAERSDTKTVAPNPDGGLFVVFDGKEPGQIEFVGYVGPKSVQVMREQMTEAGMKKIKVESTGTCEVENGLVYTVVQGSYTVPEPKPDPI